MSWPEADDFMEEGEDWKGDTYPRSWDVGWPEPEPPSEYHLLRDELEDEE